MINSKFNRIFLVIITGIKYLFNNKEPLLPKEITDDEITLGLGCFTFIILITIILLTFLIKFLI